MQAAGVCINKIGIWIKAVRAFSFTASVIPVALGAVMGYLVTGLFSWPVFILMTVSCILLHTGTNLINDYYDYKKGVDTLENLGGSGILAKGLLKPEQILKAAVLAFALGAATGVILVYISSWQILILGAAGLLGGLFYSTEPVGYKYLAVGDLLVFILMGPMMVAGSYFVMAGEFTIDIILISLPIGFLVSAILWANNLRDTEQDKEAGIKTAAMMVGIKNAKKIYISLILISYIITIVLSLQKILPLYALAVLLSAPLAVSAIKTVSAFDAGTKKTDPVMITAKLHFIFGILLITAVLIEGVFNR